MNKNHQFKFGVFGGTFDNFHNGHKFFIDKSFEKAEFITIGLTIDEFVKDKKLSTYIEPYFFRKTNLENYLNFKGLISRSKIIPISDIYGNTLIEKNVDVIFATSDTIDNAKLINLKRQELGFNPLKIIEIELQNGDDEKTISSSRIRSGEIDDFGKSFLKLFELNDKLILPQEYREDFRKPIGIVISDHEKIKKEIDNFFTITIGDIVTSTLKSLGKTPNLSIFDFKTGREDIKDEKILSSLPKNDIIMNNAPGTIEKSVVIEIHKFIKISFYDNRKYSIKIIGEEDLLTIPSILLAPIGAVVIYGQRNEGAVIVKITLQKKRNLLNKYFSKLSSYTP